MPNQSSLPSEHRRDGLYEELKRIAMRLGQGSRLPTVREIMATYGVSQSTVTAVISRLADQGIVERRDRSGIYVLKEAEHGRVLVLCEPTKFISGSLFWKNLLNGIIDQFEAERDQLLIRFMNPLVSLDNSASASDLLPGAVWEQLQQGVFESVVFLGGSERAVIDVQGLGVPVVSFAIGSKYTIEIAGVENCLLGVEELVRRGCRRIAIFNTPSLSMRELLMAALDRFGAEEVFIPFEEESVHTPNVLAQNYSAMNRGFEWGQKLSSLQPSPDGVVLPEDIFAQGFLMGMTQAGLIPGKDVEVASHTNKGSPILMGWQDKITQIEVDCPLIPAAIHAAVKAIGSGDRPTHTVWDQSVWIPGTSVGGSFLLPIRSRIIPPSALT